MKKLIEQVGEFQLIMKYDILVIWIEHNDGMAHMLELEQLIFGQPVAIKIIMLAALYLVLIYLIGNDLM
ncbi:TPA: hypothetical protein DEG21_03935 [Patescibacteria group bacterium]|nr:hypothetical protein [Candidatus Gracilibacteria bacterium]HBY74999.1 hypothetical protein [Candidatus Gracilibacteria bacterium]